MDLILWRHAEAEDVEPGAEDIARSLTVKGERQAGRMAAWLDRHLPESTRVMASPALRTRQTAQMLPRKFRIREELLPGCGVEDLLNIAQWPEGRYPVLVVGHQPTLGLVIAHVMAIPHAELVIKKGAVWWLRQRSRDQTMQTMLLTVQSPEFL